jgi:hypothetical protein
MGFTLDPSDLSSAATTLSSTSQSGPVYVVLGGSPPDRLALPG